MDISTLIPDLPQGLTKKVGDKDAPEVIYSVEKDTPELNLPGSNFLFKAQAKGSVLIKLFNDTNDPTKDDKVFKDWPEALSIYANGGLLSYSLKGTVKASAAGQNLGQFELGIDAQQSLEVISYRKHNAGDVIGLALIDDLKTFKNIFNPADVIALQPGEALSMQASGRLQLKGGVKLSDALTGSIPVVLGILNLNNKVNIKLDAALSVSASVTIEDDFNVNFICIKPDQYRVSIAKIIKKSTSVDAKAGIEAGIEDDKDLEAATNAFFEGIDDKIFKPINDALTNNQWVQQLLPVAQLAAKLLGWDQDISLEAFKEAYEKKRDEAKKKLHDIITSKIEIGIGYEYRRIKTTETLFKANFSKTALPTFYKNIITLNIGALLDAYLKNKPFELIEYFKRVTEEVSQSFGISMAFGDFHLSKKTVDKLKKELEFTIKGEEMQIRVSAFNPEIVKTFTYGKNSKESGMRIAADMRNFVKDEIALTAEKFDFEFGFSVLLDDNKLSKSKKELYDAVDWAVTWDIIPQDRFQDTVDAIMKNVYSVDEKGVKYKFFFNIPRDNDANRDDTLFTMLRNDLLAVDNGTFAAALAASLPYAEITARKSMKAKRDAYTWFWLDYVNSLWTVQKKDPDAFYTTVSDAMEMHFKNQDELLKFEATRPPGSYLDYSEASVKEVLRINFAGNDIFYMKRAFNFLNTDIISRTNYNKAINRFATNFNNVHFATDFNLRFLGRLLLDVAATHGMKDKVERGLQITYQDNGKDKVFIVA